jgi:primosomal protein N' (replication factor Y)
VLILLPEIALTQSFLERFHDRFGAPPAEWHSELAPKMREKVWRQVPTGGCASSPARGRRCSCRFAISG